MRNIIGIVPSVGMVTEARIAITKHGEVSAYLLADLKPCIEADVVIGDCVRHIGRALLDSGSNITVISPAAIPDNAEVSEGTRVYAANSDGHSDLIRCRLILGNGDIIIDHVPLEIFDLDYFRTGDIDLIIGMDLIAVGELHFQKKGSLPVFTLKM